MRCDQHIGLPQRALDFLGRYEAQGPVCPTCHRSMQAVLKVIGHYEGMFMQEYDLYRHPLNDGYADEFLQAYPGAVAQCSSSAYEPMTNKATSKKKSNGTRTKSKGCSNLRGIADGPA